MINLEKEVYMELPLGFNEKFESKVSKLKKSLYKLKQPPKSWFDKFTHSVKNQGYVRAQICYIMFIKEPTKAMFLS